MTDPAPAILVSDEEADALLYDMQIERTDQNRSRARLAIANRIAARKPKEATLDSAPSHFDGNEAHAWSCGYDACWQEVAEFSGEKRPGPGKSGP
ncbi:MAG: hypothetical protein ING19_19195 [Azospirillum sp.]|nr:hypothetical protein [Azospirillum sp.]